MRPGDPKIAGALYRPTDAAACGTAAAADDFLIDVLTKDSKGRGFQRSPNHIGF